VPFSVAHFQGAVKVSSLSSASAGANSPLAGAWTQAEQIAEQVRSMDGLGDAQREQYSTLILLAAASGLRSSELLALRINDIDFKASTVRVDESSDQQTNGRMGLCKNSPNAEALIFRCKRRIDSRNHDTEIKVRIRNSKHWVYRKGGCTGFDEDATGDGNLPESTLPSSANKWDLAPPPDSSYRGEIPLDQVCAAFSSKSLGKMERPIGIEPTPEPWQGSVLPLY